MSQSNIARPYAQALFELAQEQDNLSAWSDQLDLLEIIAADDRIVALVNNPHVSSGNIWRFIVTVMMSVIVKSKTSKYPVLPSERWPEAALSDHEFLEVLLVFVGDNIETRQISNLVKLLVRNGRVNAICDIAEAYEVRKAEAEKIVAAEMVTAIPINDRQQQQFSETLRSTLGCDVNLQFAVDEELIGGAVIRAGDWVVDGSVKAQLEQLAGTLSA